MKKLATLFPNLKKDSDLRVTKEVARVLTAAGYTVQATSEIAERLGIPSAEQTAKTDLFVALGGDGTVLRAAPLAIAQNVPVVGINLGTVGYLCSIEPSDLSPLAGLADGLCDVEEELLLSTGKESFGKEEIAVNEIVIGRDASDGIAVFRVTAGGESVDYRADGVILATPQGSTAYSLSAGGPIVARGLPAVVMTPLCPQSLLRASLVFPDSEKITVENTGASSLTVTADGREIGKILPGASLTVGKAERVLRLVMPKNRCKFETFFRKMRNLNG